MDLSNAATTAFIGNLLAALFVIAIIAIIYLFFSKEY